MENAALLYVFLKLVPIFDIFSSFTDTNSFNDSGLLHSAYKIPYLFLCEYSTKSFHKCTFTYAIVSFKTLVNFLQLLQGNTFN